MSNSPIFIIIIGVSGCGKTTNGKALAAQIGWQFYDADSFHPQGNINKMKNGISLDDYDRQPWLETLRLIITDSFQRGENGILACSALKKNYRDILTINDHVCFVYLRGDYSTILPRMQQRQGHFFNTDMLQTQFDTLEEPKNDQALIIDIANQNVDEIVNEIIRGLNLKLLKNLR